MRYADDRLCLLDCRKVGFDRDIRLEATATSEAIVTRNISFETIATSEAIVTRNISFETTATSEAIVAGYASYQPFRILARNETCQSVNKLTAGIGDRCSRRKSSHEGDKSYDELHADWFSNDVGSVLVLNVGQKEQCSTDTNLAGASETL